MFSDQFCGHCFTMNEDSSDWTPQQNKLFEYALAIIPEDAPDRWPRIAGFVAGKSPADIRMHYEELLHDLSEIESGRFQFLHYNRDSCTLTCVADKLGRGSASGSRSKSGQSERKKGVPWTEEEHRLFLIGLQKYGKGDWRSISRNAVISRTPTQVASHAQKYYLRLKSMKKENKRPSIHDITTIKDSSLSRSPPHITSNDGPSSPIFQDQSMPESFIQGDVPGPYQGPASSGFDHLSYNF